jgi:hypothetical protein
MGVNVDSKLETELQKLIAERDIRRQLFAYQEAINRADLEGLSTFFGEAKIATVSSGNADELHGVINGGEQFAQGFAVSTHSYQGSPKVQYSASNVTVEVDDSLRSATCHAYFFIFQGLDDYDYRSQTLEGQFPLQVIGCGRYLDQYENQDGGWQIIERKIYSDFSGDYSRHMRLSPQAMAADQGFLEQQEGSGLAPNVAENSSANSALK